MDKQSKPPTIRISAERKKLIASYAEAAGCLYGVLSIAEFVDVFNHYESAVTDEQEAALALQRYAKLNRYDVEYSLYKEFIVGPTLHPDEFEDDVDYLYLIRSEQNGKPRYLPQKEEFLKYSYMLHIEPMKPYADLKAYILKNKLKGKEGNIDVDGDLLNLHEMIRDGIEPIGLMEYFIEAGYPLHDIDKTNDFMQMVMNAHNNTRLFENNGFTPDELYKKYESLRSKEPVAYIPKKVGRNDPCPCGSGKKYKKCCVLIEDSGSAQLLQSERKLFYETWYRLLDYVNRELKVVDYKFSLRYPDYHDEILLHKIREKLWEQPKLISAFIAYDKKLNDEEIELLKSWEKHHVKGQFILLKYLPDAAIFMRMEEDEPCKIYAVKGMTTSIAGAIHSKLPVMLETVLLPFGDKIIYDSFMDSYAIEFGDGVSDMFSDEYIKSEQEYGVFTRLE